MLHPPTPAELFDARERARVVAAARALYLHQGIAEVSMADIGRYLRMPEHAVQRWFPDKAPLVQAVVDAHAEYVEAELHRHQVPCSTAVEELLVLRNWVSAEMSVSLSPFFQQLAADYPASRQCWEAHMAGFPVVNLRHNLQRGIAETLYHSTLDVEVQVAEWFRQVRILGAPEANGLDGGATHRALMEAFLARIVTPGGALVARRLQEAAPFY